MDFELPEYPAPTKKNGRKYAGLLLLLLLAFVIGFFAIKKEESKPALVPQGSSIASNNSEAFKTTASKPTGQEMIQEEGRASVPNANLQRETKISDESNKAIANTAKTIIKHPTPSLTKNTASQQLVSNTPAKSDLKNNTLSFETNQNAKAPKASAKTALPTDSFLQQNKQPVSNENQLAKKYSSAKKQTLVVVGPLSNLQMGLLPAPLSNEMQLELRPLSTKQTKIQAASIYFAYGYKHFTLDVEEANPLKEKVNAVLSPSFQLGLQLSLNNKWSTNVGLTYDTYHTTFEHRRDLEPEFDFQNNVKINRQEVTFHNNYTNTLGLELGLNRTWKLLNVLQVFTGISITPTYSLSTEGKTIDLRFAPTTLTNDQISKFSMNGGIKLGAAIPISRSINLGIAYQYQHFFHNKTFINNITFTKQQNNLSLILRYRFIQYSKYKKGSAQIN